MPILDLDFTFGVDYSAYRVKYKDDSKPAPWHFGFRFEIACSPDKNIGSTVWNKSTDSADAMETDTTWGTYIRSN